MRRTDGGARDTHTGGMRFESLARGVLDPGGSCDDATPRLPRGYPEATPRLPRGYAPIHLLDPGGSRDDALDPRGSHNGCDSVPTRTLGTSVPTVVVLYVPCKVHLVPLVPLGRWYCQRFKDPTHNDLWLSLLRHRPQRASVPSPRYSNGALLAPQHNPNERLTLNPNRRLTAPKRQANRRITTG